MQRVEQDLVAMGCPKLNVQVRAQNAEIVAFYEKLGYAPDQTVSLGKRLIPDA
jgi:ribosomal protein S18 acetylase RimI-like enzyme